MAPVRFALPGWLPSLMSRLETVRDPLSTRCTLVSLAVKLEAAPALPPESTPRSRRSSRGADCLLPYPLFLPWSQFEVTMRLVFES